MSYTWTSTGRGFNTDGDPQDAHPASCPIWASSDPADDCDCDPFDAGVDRLVDLFESYAAPRIDGPADGAA